jgi:hypothetical protein
MLAFATKVGLGHFASSTHALEKLAAMENVLQ